ncbi:MAG: DegT/DnrJ/EryC1/StrS family aminotransferase [Proteobacteria bacterium]|nr:DegT/DnrJ/EryC1/StrS family aminotransferase [Pseudomonadota bacterium]
MSEYEPVPFLDLKAHNEPLRASLRQVMEGVVASQRFVMGPELEAFELEIARYLGCRHAIGVSSGTDALLVSLMALEIGPCDEVITTPFSFFAAAGCIARVGAKPVFVDIDPLTYNLDAGLVNAAVTERTRAILPVHLFGQPCDMTALMQVAARHGLPVIEDAAQAIGARTDQGMVGGLGTLGCLSFFPSKNLGCFGDGGLVLTQDDALAERVRVLRVHGAKPKYFHRHVGGNFRLDAIQAAILRVKLPHLEQWTQGRRRNAACYDAWFREASLPGELLRTPARTTAGHVYNQYVIRTARRDALRAHLGARRIGSEIYYPKPLHLQECFAGLGYRAGILPKAEEAALQVLALPIFPELTQAQIRRVVDSVLAFLSSEHPARSRDAT